jgi:hypothetical protein
VKAQCDRCREIVTLEFSVAAGGIDVICPACKQAYFVSAKTRAATPPPVAGGDGTICPKCSEMQPRAEACRKCGLVFAKWRGPEVLADTDDPSLEGAREAAALFALCEEAWTDASRHDAFVAHCRRTEAFGFAAARYRAALAKAPDDEIAAGRLKQIRSLAEFLIRVPDKSGKREPTPYRGTMIVLGVAVALCIAGAIFISFFGVPGM